MVGYRLDNGNPGYTIQLLAGGNVLTQDTNGVVPGSGSFLPTSLQYTALAGDANLGQALEIRFWSHGSQTNFDDFQLNRMASVPEPGGLIGFLFVAVAVGQRRRR